MNKYLKFITSSFLFTSMLMISGCSGGKTPEVNQEDLKNERENITGNVVFASPDWQAPTAELMAEEFIKEYPNVTVEVIPVKGDVNNFMTAQVASGEIPDLVKGFQQMDYPLAQGWVAPLNEYVNGDKEFEYVPKKLLDSFIINGNLYAIPCDMTLSGVFVNIDLLETLNLDTPDYDWTTDEFLDLARKGTTSKYSGVESWGEFEREMLGMFTEGGQEYLYDIEKGEFDFTSGGLKKAFDFKEEMLSVPGLYAQNLKNQAVRDAGQEDDYQKKFGKETVGFHDGKVLFYPAGLWNYDNMKLSFEFDYYPLPYDPEVGYKQATHINQIYMTSTVKEENKKATFEFFKWMTYGYEGNMAKFRSREGMEDPRPRAYLPPTTHPTVVEYYNNLEEMPSGVKYMYEHMDSSYRVDLYKIVPSMYGIVSKTLWPIFNQITKGEVDAASIAAEAEKNVNDQMKEAQSQFEADMAQFDQYKPQEPLYFIEN